MASAKRLAIDTTPDDDTTDAGPQTLFVFPIVAFETILEHVTAGNHAALWVTITPDVANRTLAEFNVHNRTPSPAKIDQYARDMQEYNWRAKCAQPISFNVNSELDNGQNRLLACVKAGVPFPVMLVFGNDAEAFDVIDRGKKRTKADTLSYHEESNPSTLAAIVGLLVRWERNRCATSYDPTEAEILDTNARHPHARFWASVISAIRKKTGCAPGPTGFALTLISEIDHDAAQAFAERLAAGANLDAGDPILILREQFRARRDARSNTRETQAAQAACVIKAWNAHREGRKISYIRFIEGERFPTPK